jgi:hypothetical protein
MFDSAVVFSFVLIIIKPGLGNQVRGARNEEASK